MRRFRSNRGRIAWLAFFALACQFVLSFDHLHLGKTGTGAAWAALARITADAGQVPGTAPPMRSGTADEYCSVCASISLAGLVLVSVALALLAPVLFARQLPWPDANVRPVSIEHFLFSARGPPLT